MSTEPSQTATSARPGRHDGALERGMVVGRLDGPSAPRRHDDGEAAERVAATRDRRSWRGRRWMTMVAVPVVVAGLVAALAVDRPPTVRVPDTVTGVLSDAPPAPSGPLAFRWATAVGDERALVGVAVVSDTVVVATRRRAFSSARYDLVVTAHDALDGDPRWVRSFDEQGVAALVGVGAEATLLASQPRGDGAVRDHVVDGGRVVVALDAAGATRWRHDLAGSSTSIRLDLQRERLVVADATGPRELDTATGEVTRSAPGDGRWEVRRATRAWVVATATGWQVWPDDGSPAIDVGPGPAPAVTADLVVVADGNRVVARQKASDTTAWARTFRGQVEALDGVPAPGTRADQVEDFPLPAADGPTDRVEVTVGSHAESGEARVHLLDDTGGVVSTSPPRGEDPGTHLNVRVALDDQAWSLCQRSAWLWPPGNCPHDVALADGDGEVVAAVDDLVGVGRATETWSRVTTEGVIIQDGDAVTLRRWPALEVAWTLPDGAVDNLANRLHLDTSSRGIAIGSETRVDSVAWYE